MAGLDLERGGGLALWRQIEETLAAEIGQGIHSPGERLPTEAELAERFAVNRHTVRRAMAELAARGAVRVEQGRGTFVHEYPIEWSVGRRSRFSENIARAGRGVGGTLLRTLEMPASETVAESLAISAGDPIVLIERLGAADGRPISIGSHHFPAARFGGLIAAYRAEGTITAALAACGVADYTRRSTRVTARLPSADEARLLQQPQTRPVLQTESINIDPDGAIVEYGVSRMAADRVQLVLEP
jgi:GntR family phosphonate transport system transcriptional regulator